MPNFVADLGPLLSVRDLRVVFRTRTGLGRRADLAAVDGVSFDVPHRTTLGVVGESGSGKSTMGRAILGIDPVSSGEVQLEGQSLLALNRNQKRDVQKRIQMVFQDPAGSLNPRKTVRQALEEPLHLHRGLPKFECAEIIRELLGLVGLPERTVSAYPRMLSGGQQQRAAIARALTVEPDLLICDEPVSALDVSIQAQIINLLSDLQRDLGISVIFIAHDLAVVRQVSSHIIVMYLGRIVEEGSRIDIYERCRHPYTQALLASVPSLSRQRSEGEGPSILGEIPSPLNPPSGCRYRTRCPHARERCEEEAPPLRVAGDGHRVACHFFEEIFDHDSGEVKYS